LNVRILDVAKFRAQGAAVPDDLLPSHHSLATIPRRIPACRFGRYAMFGYVPASGGVQFEQIGR
jgi:hypothetical protein